MSTRPAGQLARNYQERVEALAKTAPKLTPEQKRKLAATFGGGPR